METIDMMDKRNLISKMLDIYGSIFIHVDARVENVVIPEHLKSTPQLILEIGYNLAVKIPDLVIDKRGISATLSFNRQSFWCFIPWEALFSVRIEQNEWGQLILWKNNIPTNTKTTVLQTEHVYSTKDQQKPSHLKVIK